jgi:hypothetical protein
MRRIFIAFTEEPKNYIKQKVNCPFLGRGLEQCMRLFPLNVLKKGYPFPYINNYRLDHFAEYFL